MKRVRRKIYDKIVDMDGEVWKPIFGLEGRYIVSNYGRIASLQHSGYGGVIINRDYPKLRKLQNRPDGYLVFGFKENKTKKQLAVHRCVAIAFVPYVYGKDFVNHINGVMTDNRFYNLEWCTQKENVHHADRIGLRKIFLKGVDAGNSKLTEAEVIDIFNSKNKVIRKEISVKYNISMSTVSCIWNGRSWNHITNIQKPNAY